MAEYRTDLSRSIAGGKPDSPAGALKKAGLVGATSPEKGMFDFSGLENDLGYNDPNNMKVLGENVFTKKAAPAIAGGDPALAAIKAKDAAITAAPTRVTPNAGITQAMVQKPVQAIAGPAAAPAPSAAPSKSSFVAAGNASLVSTPQAIAGMTPDNLQTVGKMMDTGMSANGVRRMDALNRKAIAGIGTSGNGLLDDKGRTYDEQVAHAKQVNAANALPTMSPKQAAELAIANDPRRSRVTRANAAQGVAMFNNQMENAKTLLGNQQAQTIAGIKEQGDKYTADQHLAGVKYNADAHTKAAEIAGGAAVQKAQLDARVKAGEQKQKDTTALQSKVYDQIMKGYDFTGISPTTVHDYATTMAKTAGKGYVTIADPTGTHGDAIVHPGVAAFANQHLKAVKTPDQYVRLLQELDKVAAGGIHRTGIKSSQQLRPLKVSPNQIAGMTTEQG